MKILVATDFVVPPTIVKKCLENCLKGVGSLEFRLIEIEGEPLPKLTEVHEYWGSPQDLIDNIDEAEVLVVHQAPVTKDVIEAGRNLRVIGCCRGGPVNVNIEAATKRGLPVLHTPGRNADAVADFTIGLILAEARSIARADAFVKAGCWRKSLSQEEWENFTGPELSGKTIGVVGFGDVGSRVATRARGGFDMNVLVYDPYVSKEKVEELGGKKVDLKTLLKESDFITLHVRLPSNVKGFIDARHFALMKKTAYLINTSRGNAVDEQALYEALKDRKIAGAALDVFMKEPIDSDNPLLKLDNITLTPHIAGDELSQEVRFRSAQMIAEDIARLIKGERPKRIQNPSVLGRKRANT